METNRNFKRKRHKRHKWEIADDSCFNCGSYSEYCKVEGCTAMKYCDIKGKCDLQE